MKVIFLDIDGVLNGVATAMAEYHVKTGKRKNTDIDTKCLGLLGYIIKETGAKIVISSSWRTHHSEFGSAYFTGYFRGMGWHCENDMIIGETPWITNGKGISRGHEIRAWLHIGMEDIEDWIILDDEDFNFVEAGIHKDRHFKTCQMEGMSLKVADAVIKRLGKLNEETE